MTDYDRGDKVRLTATFTDLVGVPVDPPSIYMRIMNPSNAAASVATYSYTGGAGSIVRAGAGAYYVDFLIASYLPGGWNFRWESWASNQVAEESAFNVRTSPFL